MRIAVIYRERAVPLVWTVLEHGSSSVAYTVYAPLLDAAARLVPADCTVLFLADRGFADTELVQHLKHLGWHGRIRIKGSFLVYYQGECHKLQDVKLAQGQARFGLLTKSSANDVNANFRRSLLTFTPDFCQSTRFRLTIT